MKNRQGGSKVNKLKTAVVGTGGFGSLHAQAYFEHPYTELCAVVNRTEEKGKKVAERFNARYYKYPEELLENEDFDIVSVCTREHSHKDLGLLFSKAGKKILMEKPLAPSLEEALELVDGIEKDRTFMCVNYILRQDPRFLELKRMVDNGDMGEAVSYIAHRKGTYVGGQYYGPWSDLLISTVIHDLDLMIWLNGTKPVRVYGESISKKHIDIGVEDAFAATIKFADGAIGSVSASWVLPSTLPLVRAQSFHLIGTKGGLFVDGSNHGLQVCKEEGYKLPDMAHWPIISNKLSGNLRSFIDDFINTIISGGEPAVSGKEALKSLEVVFAIKKSIETKLPVTL